MRQALTVVVVIAIVLAWPSILCAGRPVVGVALHEATFQNLADYPQYSFYLAAGNVWQPVQPRAPVKIGLEEWKGASLHLYAIPRQNVERSSGLPPEEWIDNPPTEVKKSAEPLTPCYEWFADFDVIGYAPRHNPRRQVVDAGIFVIREDPPGTWGPIVPVRYLTTCKVAVSDELHLTIVSDQAFNLRGNEIIQDWRGKWIVAPPWYVPGTAMSILIAASLMLLGFFILRWMIRAPRFLIDSCPDDTE
jgi:hypothetical protein